ncbi:MAG: hypothetical protein Kow00122_11250 [Thermoleophilia bacterium]
MAAAFPLGVARGVAAGCTGDAPGERSPAGVQLRLIPSEESPDAGMQRAAAEPNLADRLRALRSGGSCCWCGSGPMVAADDTGQALLCAECGAEVVRP